jgi:zinc transport system substrate-binding protein
MRDLVMRPSFIATIFTCLLSTSALAAPKVVVSIVPIHGLVSEVMAGVAEPQLLLQGTGSEHQASYSPEQIKQMADADLMVIIGQGLELKLSEISGSETVAGKKFYDMSGLQGLITHPIREGGAWEAHEDDHGHEESEQAEEEHEEIKAKFDPHIWLDPRNAALFATAVAQELGRIDQANAATYSANATKLVADLTKLEADLAAELETVKGKPFIVFHDAFQYFERRFDLNAAGSIADISATAPSAKRLKALRQKVKEVKAVCAFAEPQFSSKALETVTEGAKTKAATLDGIGADVSPGPGAYQTVLRNLAKSFKTCLSG